MRRRRGALGVMPPAAHRMKFDSLLDGANTQFDAVSALAASNQCTAAGRKLVQGMWTMGRAVAHHDALTEGRVDQPGDRRLRRAIATANWAEGIFLRRCTKD